MSQTKKHYTDSELISALEDMDRQVIHGSDIFLQAANRIRSLKAALEKEFKENHASH